MPMDTDQWLQRRQARRQGLVWKIIAVLALTTVGVLVVSGLSSTNFGGMAKLSLLGGGETNMTSDHIARLNIEGIIMEDRWRDALIQEIQDDPLVKGVVVYVNSPGGAVVGGENLYRNLRALGEVKPVAAVMGSLAASAGYMTAISADRIFAREGTLTGSIGVLFEATEVTGLLGKLGVKAEMVKSAPLKAQPNPIEPFSVEGRAAIKAVVMDMYDMFVDMVAGRRKLSRDQVLKLADGRIFTGRQAVKNGLVDQIGGESEAVAWMETEKGIEKNLPVFEVKPTYPRPDFIKRMLGATGKALFSERLALDGLLAVWHPKM